MSTQNRFTDKISNELTAQLPAIEFDGEVVVVDDERAVEAACEYLAAQPVIGFDTETRPSFRAGVTFRVSLLQLSSPERCYLFRLNRIPLAKPILQLLGDERVLKIGADVAGDLRSLRQIRHFRDGGFVDLQQIAPEWGIEEKSLRKLSAIVLGKRVSKAQRLSNWEAATLTDKQRTYAATDAWVCTRIYERLQQAPKAPRRTPAETTPAAAGETTAPGETTAGARSTKRSRPSARRRRHRRTPKKTTTA
ncbi:MAG: 3'-5' exonuclease domain-containing protein 2 [Alistipes sp.]|nr:3'-5' exonuclease domain-containing protein 2 [Alistipes sp.]